MLLAPAEQALRARQRSALQELEHTLVRMDASEADTTTLRESITVLDSLFLCCVLGEFNAGKSALLNALLGGNHCGEGVLPTTAAITLIKHPSVPFEPSHAQSEVEVLNIPRSWLRGLHLVDTPGTNSIESAHTALTQGFLPRADLVLFVTSAERPFSQSEQELLRAVADWRKPVLCVLNKADLLDATQLHTVSEYIAAQARVEP